MYDKILKKKLQYTSNGTVYDVFKGSTHHGGLGLSFRFSKLSAAYPGELPSLAMLQNSKTAGLSALVHRRLNASISFCGTRESRVHTRRE